MKTINLGYEAPDYGELATAAPEPEEKKTKTHYPSFYIHDAPKELMGLTDEGEALITFKVVNKTMSDREGKKSCSCELEVQSITPKNMPQMDSDGDQPDSEDAFDKYLEENDAD